MPFYTLFYFCVSVTTFNMLGQEYLHAMLFYFQLLRSKEIIAVSSLGSCDVKNCLILVI
jgi:hypothetical protein